MSITIRQGEIYQSEDQIETNSSNCQKLIKILLESTGVRIKYKTEGRMRNRRKQSSNEII